MEREKSLRPYENKAARPSDGELKFSGGYDRIVRKSSAGIEKSPCCGERTTLKFYSTYFMAMLACYMTLCLHSKTGTDLHLTLAVAVLFCTVLFTVKTCRHWDKPALELLYRFILTLSLGTGYLMSRGGVTPLLLTAHRICAGAFVALLITLYFQKAFFRR